MPIDPVVYLLLMVHAVNRANRGGYRGELRAIGDVLRAFDDYSVSYQ